MKSTLLVPALLCAAATVRAADWQPYVNNGDVTIYVATDRIDRQGDTIDIWDKNVFRKPRHLGDGRQYDYTISHESVSCSSNSSEMHEIIAYRNDGKVVLSSESGSDGWQRAVPDSIEESLISELCRP